MIFDIVDTGGIDPTHLGRSEPLSIGSADYIEEIKYQAWQRDGTSFDSFSTKDNLPPDISILTPKQNQEFKEAGMDIKIKVRAGDREGAVKMVSFYKGPDKLGSVTKPPYEFSWPKVAEGKYRIFARARDNLGVWGASEKINLVV